MGSLWSGHAGRRLMIPKGLKSLLSGRRGQIERMFTGDDPDLIRTVLLYIDERIRDPKGEDRMNDQHIRTGIRLQSELMTEHEKGMPCFPNGRPAPRGRGINGRRRYYDPCPLLVIEEFPGYRKDAVYERV